MSRFPFPLLPSCSQGFFSFVNVVGAIMALSYVSATNLSVLQPSIPVFTMLLSVMFRMEGLNVYKILGIAASVGGALCVKLLGENSGGISAKDQKSLMIGNIIIIVQVTR